ncbi:MAG TPA: malonyl-CoA synthase, partial [Propylenella sp.]
VPRRGALVDEEAIITALRERLAAYKLPKRVIVVDELPRNAMAKVQKAALREQYAGLFARQSAAR